MRFLRSLAKRFATSPEKGLLDRLCRENGWPINDRSESGKAIRLRFDGTEDLPPLSLTVAHGDGDPVATFSCTCRAMFTAASLPDRLPFALLARNGEASIGGWAVYFDDAESLALDLKYTAPAAGLDAFFFRHICTSLVKEVSEIECLLDKHGLF